MTKKKLITLVCTITLILGLNAFAKEQQVQVLDLTWEDLVPNDYEFKNPLDKLSDEEYNALTDDSEKAQKLMEEVKKLMDFAPVVDELNGKTVRISGYAVPLDFNEQNVREFLLVPYFGACIHVPPPPGNQTVYVTIEEGLEMQGLWDPITVLGKLQTVHVSSDLAEAGYSIAANDVEPYQQPVED
jgi:hypothetical protein